MKTPREKGPGNTNCLSDCLNRVATHYKAQGFFCLLKITGPGTMTQVGVKWLLPLRGVERSGQNHTYLHFADEQREVVHVL